MRNRRLLIVSAFLLTLTLTTMAQEPTTESTRTPIAESSATPPAPTAPGSVSNAGGNNAGISYTVQRGDNLFRIASRYGLTMQTLAEANGIANPNLIFAGQPLVIPGPGLDVDAASSNPSQTSATDADTTSYIVQSGDTLLRLSLVFNTTVPQLVELNNVSNPDLIFVGQDLRIPVNEGTITSTRAFPQGNTGPTEASQPVGNTSQQPASTPDRQTGIRVFYEDADVQVLATAVARLATDWVRLTVDWRNIQPTPDELQFAALDDAITAFEAIDVDILLTLVGTPDWARPSATDYARSFTMFHGPPDDLNDFYDFAFLVSSRYRGRVTAYQIWTEPNLRRNWIDPRATLRTVERDGETRLEPINAGLASTEYIDLLEAGYRGVRAGDPRATVITAGLAPTGLDDQYNAVDTFIFLEKLIAQGAFQFSDAIGVHIDGFNNPPEARCCGDAESDPRFDESYHFFYYDMLQNHRTILNRRGGRAVPLWITHLGWGTADNANTTPDPATQGYLLDNSALDQANNTYDAIPLATIADPLGPIIFTNLNGCETNQPDACYYSFQNASGQLHAVSDAFTLRNIRR